MQIEIVTNANDEVYAAFQRLVPQLTNNNRPPSLDDLTTLVQDTASTLIIARSENNDIVGGLTLAIYRVPTGIRAVIEDVIVDISARGEGYGEALMMRAIELAREKGAGNISLTSNPMRVAANILYLRVGFTKRETNVYQIKL